VKTIEYRITYSGTLQPDGTIAGDDPGAEEIARVTARDINSGFAKALRLAREPLGNGRRREIARIEFWMAH
jgi:hypothetical protein